MTMNLIAISDARAQLPDLVQRVSQYLDRILITVNGKPKVAVVSVEELEALEETAEILSIPGAKASINRGRNDVKKRRGVSFSHLP